LELHKIYGVHSTLDDSYWYSAETADDTATTLLLFLLVPFLWY
jgi:hypothetical protein